MAPVKIATWNINGVKARLETAIAWLQQAQPDIACLQEIKSIDAGFPSERFEELGYNVVTHGQKGFNGVAILSKLPFDSHQARLPGDESDEHARYLEGCFSTPSGMIRVVSIYLPNGNPVESEKFPYKLAWMDRLYTQVRTLLEDECPLVVAGDFNVIVEPEDAKRPEVWVNDALFQPESRARWRSLINLGLTDATRAVNTDSGVYTFWDYQAGAWPKNNGIRIDHMLLSPQAADRLVSSGIDRETRGWEKPSDHVPVWIELDLD